MYGSRKKKWTYIALALMLVIQLSLGLSGIFDDIVFADKPVKNKLDTPSNIQTSATADTVTLRWNPAVGAESYDVEMNGNLILDPVQNVENLTNDLFTIPISLHIFLISLLSSDS